MIQLVDVFAKPAMCLLGAVVQWFVDERVRFVPESIFADVRESVNRYAPFRARAWTVPIPDSEQVPPSVPLPGGPAA